MDEVPILVNRLLLGEDYKITTERRQAVDIFMSWLRDNSLKHTGKIRLVVTGSIGLEPVLQRAGLSATINHLTPFELAAWQPKIVKEFILEVTKAEQLRFEPDALDHIIESLGSCIPHHVQLFVKNIRESCQLEETLEVTKIRVAEVYQNRMLGIRGHADLNHMEERLRQTLGPELYPLTLEMLTEAAVVGHLTEKAVKILSRESNQSFETAKTILRTFEHDGYFQRDAQGYRFVSNLLKDWWKRIHSFGYTPAEQRGSQP